MAVVVGGGGDGGTLRSPIGEPHAKKARTTFKQVFSPPANDDSITAEPEMVDPEGPVPVPIPVVHMRYRDRYRHRNMKRRQRNINP